MSTVQVNQINNLNGNTPITVNNLYQYVSYIEDIRSGDATRITRGLNGLGLKGGAVQNPGAANGLATLDSNQRLVGSQLPDTNIGRPGDVVFAPIKPTNGTWVKADGSIYSKSVYPDAASNIGPYMDFRNVVTNNLPGTTFYTRTASDGSIVTLSIQSPIIVYRSTDGGASYTSYNTNINIPPMNESQYNNIVYMNGIWLLQISNRNSDGSIYNVFYKSTNLTTWSSFPTPSNLPNNFYVLGAINGLFNFIPFNSGDSNPYYTTDGTAWSTANDAAFKSKSIGSKSPQGSSVRYANGYQFILPNGSQPISYTNDGKTWNFTPQSYINIVSVIYFKGQYVFTSNNGINYISSDLNTFTASKAMVGIYGDSMFPEHLSNANISSVNTICTLFDKYMIVYVSYQVLTTSSSFVTKYGLIYTEDLIEWKLLFKANFQQFFPFSISTNNGTRLTGGQAFLGLSYDPSSQFQVPIVRNSEMGMNMYPWIKLK